VYSAFLLLPGSDYGIIAGSRQYVAVVGLTTDEEEALVIFLKANEVRPSIVDTCTFFIFIFISFNDLAVASSVCATREAHPFCDTRLCEISGEESALFQAGSKHLPQQPAALAQRGFGFLGSFKENI